MKDVVFDDLSGPEASAVQQVLAKNPGLPWSTHVSEAETIGEP